MEHFKKLSLQTLWQLLNKAVSTLSTFFILGLSARYFGKTGIGVYTLALTYLGMFYLLADFGFNAHILPSLKESEGELKWRKLLGLRIVWSLMLVFLAIFLIPFLPFSKDGFPRAVLFGAVAIFGNSLFTSATALFQSRLSLEFSAIASSVGIISMTILMYFFIFAGLPISYLLIAQSLGWLLTGALALLLAKRYLKSLIPIFDLGFIKSFFVDTWPISLTLALNLVYFRFDSFVISSIKSLADVGVYNLAYSVFQSVLVLPAFIMNGLYPLMVEELKLSKKSFFRYFKRSVFSLLGLSVTGTVATLILAPFIINLVSGSGDFSGSILSLRILSLGFPVYFLTALFMWTLVTLKEYKSMAVVYLGGLFLNISLNLIFIPKYSYVASSWITVASELLILFLQLVILIPAFKKLK